ncbi:MULTISPECIES: DUF6049 family protein [unclassified Microbacterium]|uniref:DUF6049 family protein n=1 Tax=unclassified Microbacterium TaxID=2609290 RepID=UPI00214ACDC0|nr:MULTISPECIES: DUF6049 family protein [unclassified Microbacterium]MCR2783073.1 DUF6049 family protein [Microbacterium sp. zg.B96]WIM16042.1 DUF6049 family protein [Microbacterium sp. zg-B96]
MTDIPAAPRRPWLVALLTALLVLLTVAPGLTAAAVPTAPAATSAAGSPDPDPSGTPEPAPGVVELILSPIGDGALPAGSALTVSATVTNGTLMDIPAAEIVLEMGTTALPDRAALSDWVAGDGRGRDLEPAGTTLVEAVAAGDRDTVGITVAADSPLLAGRAPGVYPLRATATNASGTLVTTSVVVIADDAVAEVGVGVAVPITAPALEEGLLSAEELVALTAPEGGLTAQLESVAGTSAILAIDPAIPAAIRALGTAAPEAVTAWLQRLEQLPNERFALQFGDADVAAQLNSGLPQPLAPTSLQPYLEADDFVPDADATPTPTPTLDPLTPSEPSPTPTPTPTPGAPEYPTLEELLSVGGSRQGVYWPFTGTANAPVVATLGGLTTDDQASLTLIPSATTTQGANDATLAAHARADAASVLVYDSAISDALRRASQLEERALRAATLTEATAHLAFAVQESGGRPLLVTLDRADGRSRLAMSMALSTVDAAPGVVPATLQSLVSGEPAAVSIADVASDEARTTAVTDLLADEAALTDFATILDDPTVLTAPERAGMLQILGSAWIADAEAWQAALARHREATVQTLGSVSIPQLTDITLVGQNVPLRIWVRNSLEWPVNVVLIAQPSAPRLLVQRASPVRAEPEANTRIEIPVEARVGNGEVDLRLELLSPSYIPIGTAQTATVLVRADWEVIGVAALAVVVGGLLVIGLWRTVRRRRRARADHAATPQIDQADRPGEDGQR